MRTFVDAKINGLPMFDATRLFNQIAQDVSKLWSKKKKGLK